jgi:hypothetical protein
VCDARALVVTPGVEQDKHVATANANPDIMAGLLES